MHLFIVQDCSQSFKFSIEQLKGSYSLKQLKKLFISSSLLILILIDTLQSIQNVISHLKCIFCIRLNSWFKEAKYLIYYLCQNVDSLILLSKIVICIFSEFISHYNQPLINLYLFVILEDFRIQKLHRLCQF